MIKDKPWISISISICLIVMIILIPDSMDNEQCRLSIGTGLLAPLSRPLIFSESLLCRVLERVDSSTIHFPLLLIPLSTTQRDSCSASYPIDLFCLLFLVHQIQQSLLLHATIGGEGEGLRQRFTSVFATSQQSVLYILSQQNPFLIWRVTTDL
jgi:hypothetical protein